MVLGASGASCVLRFLGPPVESKRMQGNSGRLGKLLGEARGGGLGPQNPLLESSWRLTEPSWRLLESLGGTLGALGAVLEASWEVLGRSWAEQIL